MTRRPAAVLLLALLPWTVLAVDGDVELVFLWALVNTDPIHVVSLSAYVFDFTRGLPDRLIAWPASTVLYAAAAAGTVVGVVAGREDRRLTAGLLALAGLSHLGFALGIGRRNPAAVAAPIGPILAWAVVWWFDWPVIRRAGREATER